MSQTTPEKKNYIVTIQAYTRVLVIGAESEDKAYQYARQEVSMMDWELEQANFEVVPDDDIESARRDVNAVNEG